MPGGGRDPRAVQMSVGMKDASPFSTFKPDKAQKHLSNLYQRNIPKILIGRQLKEDIRKKLLTLLYKLPSFHQMKSSVIRLLKYLDGFLVTGQPVPCVNVAASAGGGGTG
jgi:hypothetical protein